MLKYDVMIQTNRGELVATLNAEPVIPTGLLLQAVMCHQQLVPALVQLRANNATTIAIHTPSRLELPPGLTIQFADGVNVNGPVQPSPIEGVPQEFDGVQLTHNLAAVVTYAVEL